MSRRQLLRLWSIVPIVFIAFGFTILLQSNPVTVRAVGTNYYIDCNTGNDASAGTSETTAWKTLSKANSARLQAGDKLLLKRGCSWTGPLNASWNGTETTHITITAYGSGPIPVIKNASSVNITVSGSYQVVENIETYHTLATTTQEYEFPTGCFRKLSGWKLGVNIVGTAHHNSIKNMVIHDSAVGIKFGDDSHDNNIVYSTIYDNKYAYDIDPVKHPIGMMGVLLHGDDNEVAFNNFESTNVTKLGAKNCVNQDNSIEIYRSKRGKIHHNISSGDRVFSEMGSNPNLVNDLSEDNVFAYNLHVTEANSPRFINTRGVGHNFGPVWRTKAFNNTVYHQGNGDGTVICSICSDKIFTFENNIVYSDGRAFYANGGNPVESHNIYWSKDGSPQMQGITIDTTSKIVNPQFKNSGQNDFHLLARSPAINTGTSEPQSAGWNFDLDRVSVPQQEKTDIGAYEYGELSGTPTLTPTPSSILTLTPTLMPECGKKPLGDADCNGKIDLADFEVWRKEYTKVLSSATADFDSSSLVNLVDFEVWRRNFMSL